MSDFKTKTNLDSFIQKKFNSTTYIPKNLMKVDFIKYVVRLMYGCDFFSPAIKIYILYSVHITKKKKK